MANIEPIYQEIASKITKEENKTLPRVLKKIASLEQARILRELPNTIEEIAKKLAVDENTVSKNLQYLYERGLVTPGRKRLEPGEQPGSSERPRRFSQSQV